MSFRDTVRKYQKLIREMNNKTTLVWVDDVSTLTKEQIEDSATIYLYLET